MITTLRSEWIKLRTVRVNLVLLIVAVAFPLVVTVLVGIFGEEPETVRSSELADLVGGLAVVPAMLLGTVAALGLTSEYGFGTIRPTFAATPSRVRVAVAKLVVGAAAAAVVSLLIVALCWSVGAAILSARDGSVSLSVDDGSAGALVAVIVLSVELTLFAFGVAAIVRSSPAAVTVLLLWPLVAEGIIAALLSAIGAEDLTRWLPYSAAISTVVADPASDVLGRPGGWIWFGVVSAALVAIGVTLVQRRDA